MEKPLVAKSFLDSLDLVHEGLSVIWNAQIERFQIFYTDKRNGLKRILATVEDENGDYRPCDMRTILYLSDHIAWNLLDTYPEPKDWYNHILLKKTISKDKARIDFRDYIKQWNRENRSRWKKAKENAERGIFSIPKTEEKKIYIYR